MPGNVIANPNLEILAYQREGISVAPLTTPGNFRSFMIGWQNEGNSFGLFFDFSNANRVAMQMPYDGFIHQWIVRHSNYPQQQQGNWRWVLGHNFDIADSFIDSANPTFPFNPGPGVHERSVFSKVIGQTDQPFPFEQGDFIWFALGSNKGLFTVTRNGFVFCSVSVMVEFIRK